MGEIAPPPYSYDHGIIWTHHESNVSSRWLNIKGHTSVDKVKMADVKFGLCLGDRTNTCHFLSCAGKFRVSEAVNIQFT